MFSGSLTALITPLRNGALDEAAFGALVERQIAEGTTGLIPCGTTGESATLSHDEHRRVVALCVEAAAGRAPVIAGAGSNSTEEAIDLSRYAKEVGADALLLVTPYYNKPNQEGMYQHFRAVAEAVDLPIVLYNIPARSAVDMSIDTIARLSRIPNIVALKDAANDVSRVARQAAAAVPGFVQLSGEDGTAIGFNAHGGVGCISVTANVAPRLCAEMQAACLRNDYATARAINDKLAALHHALFIEPSPAPAKYACSLLGLCTDDVRLPLVPPSEPAKAQIRQAMVEAGLLN